MSEKPNAPKPAEPAANEIHWGISYLREDIQDLRQQVGAVHSRVDAVNQSLIDRIDTVNQSLIDRIDGFNESLLGRIDETNRSLNERIDSRIDETNKRMDAGLQSLGTRIDEASKRHDTRFTWLIGTLVALAGIIIAAIKL